MAIQASSVNSSVPFFMGGPSGIVSDSETILTDASRTVPLYQYTVMSQIASTMKWTPWIQANLGGTTGTQYPMGILMAPDGYTAALYAAGDITNVPILVMGPCEVDYNQLVFDRGSTGVGTLPTLVMVPTVPTNAALIANQYLMMRGIYVKYTYAIDTHEN